MSEPTANPLSTGGTIDHYAVFADLAEKVNEADLSRVIRAFGKLPPEARATVLACIDAFEPDPNPFDSDQQYNLPLTREFFRAVFTCERYEQALIARMAWRMAQSDLLYPPDLLTATQRFEEGREDCQALGAPYADFSARESGGAA